MPFLIVLLFSVAAAAGAPEARLTISAVGDIMMGTTYPAEALPEAQGARLFKNAISYIQTSDIRFGNLEGTLFDGALQADGKRGGPNRYLFRTPTAFGRRLAEAGFNVVSLSNNHAMDFGRAGIESTKKTLKTNGIQYSSKDGDLASFEVRGLRVALIATDFYPGSRSVTNPQSTYREIQDLKRKFDIVLVSAHVGMEGEDADHVHKGPEFYLGENRGDSISFAHGAIDAGADVLIMHGPHVPRAIEIYREHAIVYSLGNFVTERGILISGKSGLAPLVRLQIDGQGRFLQGQLTSFEQTRTQGIVYDPGIKALRLIESVSKTDFPNSHPEFRDNGLFTAPTTSGSLR